MRLLIVTIFLSMFSVAALNAQTQRDRAESEGSRTPTNPSRTSTSAPRSPSRSEMNVAPVTNGDGDVFTVVEVMPEFPGGQTGLNGYLGSITYPDDALDNNWQGKVYLTFIINKDGTISEVEVVRSSGYDVLDKAAKYHIETMPPWKPGTQRGKPVRVKYTLPMVFKLG